MKETLRRHLKISETTKPKPGKKVYPGFSIIRGMKIFENPKESYSTENLTLKLHIGHKLCEGLEKIDNVIRELKKLHSNFKKSYPNLCAVMYAL